MQFPIVYFHFKVIQTDPSDELAEADRVHHGYLNRRSILSTVTRHHSSKSTLVLFRVPAWGTF
jgi:hypothetical protein